MDSVKEFILAGTSASCAVLFTNPLEVAKTRIQLQGELRAAGKFSVYYSNVFHALYTICKSESVSSLQKGIVPAIGYQFVMSSVRLGAFQCIDNLDLIRDKNSGKNSFFMTVIASACSGCVGAFFSSPFYMIKIQLQAKSDSKIAVGYQHKYASFSSAFSKIVSENGTKGLWRGATASMVRIAVGSSVQLTTFSRVKDLLEKHNIARNETYTNTLLAASCSGILQTIFMQPFDLVATRLYNQPVDSINNRGLKYDGIIDCLRKVMRTEGLLGFYKGGIASFLRIAPHTVITLFFWREFRKNYFAFELKFKNVISTPVA